MKLRESEKVELKKSTSELKEGVNMYDMSVSSPHVQSHMQYCNAVKLWDDYGMIKRIHDSCIEEGVKFEFKELMGGFLVILYREMDFEKRSGVNGGVSERVNEGVSSLLAYILKNPGKRIPHFEKALKVPAKTIERWIKKLKNEGKIEFKGSSKKGGYYSK